MCRLTILKAEEELKLVESETEQTPMRASQRRQSIATAPRFESVKRHNAQKYSKKTNVLDYFNSLYMKEFGLSAFSDQEKENELGKDPYIS